MAGKGGGAWKVAYADFVTAMMAFFLVMWIVAQNKPVKEAVAQFFKDPYGTGKKGTGMGGGPLSNGGAPPSLRDKLAKRGRLKIKSKSAPVAAGTTDTQDAAAAKPSVFVLHGGEKPNLGTLVVFGEDSAELDERGKEHLNELMPMLLGKLNKIEIRGHATGRPLPPNSPFQDAWQLCYARCLAAMEFLREQGVEPQRIRLSQAGSYEPQSLRADSASAVQNSRVEVYMLGEFVDDLQGDSKQRTGSADPPHGKQLVGP